MSLPLIAEVLAGETLITPGGPVDNVTATGQETFLWERWLEDAILGAEEAGELELNGEIGVLDAALG